MYNGKKTGKNASVQRAVWRNGGITPQTILWEFGRYYLAASSVGAATAPSRWDVVAQSASLLAPQRLVRLHRELRSSLRELRTTHGFAKLRVCGGFAPPRNFAKPCEPLPASKDSAVDNEIEK
jgi:hypothetical protein